MSTQFKYWKSSILKKIQFSISTIVLFTQLNLKIVNFKQLILA